jgi:hypothetical protein
LISTSRKDAEQLLLVLRAGFADKLKEALERGLKGDDRAF